MMRNGVPKRSVPAWLLALRRGRQPTLRELNKAKRRQARDLRNPSGRCYVCNDATIHHGRVLVGNDEEYVALCPAHLDLAIRY